MSNEEVKKPQEKKIKQDVCIDLKNIQYQTMLMQANSNTKTSITSSRQTVGNIDDFLKKETESNKDKPWNKLEKATKLKLLINFVNEYSKEKKLTKEETLEFKKTAVKELDRKKLQKIKDVTYDKDNGKIKCLNNLIFNKSKNKYTFKRDKKSILNNLAPKTRKRKKKSDKKKEKKMKEKKEKSNIKKEKSNIKKEKSNIKKEKINIKKEKKMKEKTQKNKKTQDKIQDKRKKKKTEDKSKENVKIL